MTYLLSTETQWWDGMFAAWGERGRGRLYLLLLIREGGGSEGSSLLDLAPNRMCVCVFRRDAAGPTREEGKETLTCYTSSSPAVVATGSRFFFLFSLALIFNASSIFGLVSTVSFFFFYVTACRLCDLLVGCDSLTGLSLLC